MLNLSCGRRYICFESEQQDCKFNVEHEQHAYFDPVIIMGLKTLYHIARKILIMQFT